MNNINFDSLPEAVHALSTKVDYLTMLLQSEKPDVKQNDLLVIKDAAKLLNLSKPTLYGKVSKREIPFMKRGNRLYFSKTELIDYIKSGKVFSDREIEDQTDTFLSNSKR